MGSSPKDTKVKKTAVPIGELSKSENKKEGPKIAF
jgi:hypothetical protein